MKALGKQKEQAVFKLTTPKKTSSFCRNEPKETAKPKASSSFDSFDSQSSLDLSLGKFEGDDNSMHVDEVDTKFFEVSQIDRSSTEMRKNSAVVSKPSLKNISYLQSVNEQSIRKINREKRKNLEKKYKLNLKTLDQQQVKALQMLQKCDSVRIAIQSMRKQHKQQKQMTYAEAKTPEVKKQGQSSILSPANDSGIDHFEEQ